MSRKLQFQNCSGERQRIAGLVIKPDDYVEVTLSDDVDFEPDFDEEGQGEGGPWGWAGYTTEFVKSLGEVEAA